jgi:hypothetical protein
MAFSKKHYWEIVRLLKDRQRPYNPFTTPEARDFDEGYNEALSDIVDDLCDFFKKDNSNFSRDKFLDAFRQ